MSIFDREQRSLFGEILDWMLTPLLLLWPISLVLTWLVAQNIAGKPFDRALEYNVAALAQLVTVDTFTSWLKALLPRGALLPSTLLLLYLTVPFAVQFPLLTRLYRFVVFVCRRVCPADPPAQVCRVCRLQ